MTAGPQRADVLDVTAPGFDASDGFWSEFVGRYWGRRPVVIRSPFPELIVDRAAAFSALTSACDEFRACSDVPRIRLAVDGGFLLVDMDERLPLAADGSFAGYAERLRPWLSGRSLLMTLNEYHRYDLVFWKRIRTWLRGLFGRVGLPSGFFLTNLWFGIYDRTPFGIHTDHAETFAYLVFGAKRMLVWPLDVFAARRAYRTPGGDHLGTARYEPFLDQAILLEGRPGDLLYWPESYWHVGVSDGASPTLTCNWAYTNKELPRGAATELVARELARLAHDALGERGFVDSYPMDPDRVEECGLAPPAPLGVAREALRAIAQDPALDDAVHRAWLNRLTGMGFREAPAARTRLVLTERDVVRGDARAPIVCVPRSEECLVSSHGVTFSIPNEPALVEIVARLNSGEPRSVAELESNLTFRDARGVAYARLLIEQLAAIHALDARLVR